MAFSQIAGAFVRRALVLVCIILFSGVRAGAQQPCVPQWLPEDPVPGISGGHIYAGVLWDPDGPGGHAPLRAFGGSFDVAGGLLVKNIVALDRATGEWSSIGGGLEWAVTAMAVSPTGQLTVVETAAYPVRSARLKCWNGMEWASLGLDVDGYIYSIAYLPNGDLIAGGTFTAAAGQPLNYIARRSANGWTSLGGGMNDVVDYVQVAPTGEVIASGNFTSAGGVPASRFARWDGTAWSAFASAPALTDITLKRLLANGHLVIGGQSNVNGSVTYKILEWSGAAWTSLWTSTSNSPQSLFVWPDGRLGATRLFSANGVYVGYYAAWDGTQWVRMPDPQVGGILDRVLDWSDGTITVYNGIVLKQWNGGDWSDVGSGTNWQVNVAKALHNGDVVVGGNFSKFRDTSISYISRWNGSVWSHIGPDVFVPLNDFAELPNGNIVAVGEGIRLPGSLYNDKVAIWNGSTWTGIGWGFDGRRSPELRAVVPLPDGQFMVGGIFSYHDNICCLNNVARWTGSGWTQLGSGINGDVYALLAHSSGSIIAGGLFSSSSTMKGVASWDGSSWSALGSGLDGYVKCLVELPGGDVVAGGGFICPSNPAIRDLARWDGSAWQAIGGYAGGYVFAMTPLRDGGLLVGGPALHRWDGASWTSIANVRNGWINTLLELPDRSFIAGGQFTRIGDHPAAYLARFGVPEGCSVCDPDFNQDGSVDQSDISALVDLMGGSGPPGFNPDFNRDGNVDQRDIDSLINVVAGGNCP